MVKRLLLKEVYKDMLPGGLADTKTPKDFDPKELARGIKVELEHTDDKDLAREIAMDHLAEDPMYYQKLKGLHSEGVLNEIDREEAENYYRDILRRNPSLHDQLERVARFALFASRSTQKGPSDVAGTLRALFNKNHDIDPFQSGDTMGVEMYIDHLSGDDPEIAGNAKRFYNNVFNALLKNRYEK